VRRQPQSSITRRLQVVCSRPGRWIENIARFEILLEKSSFQHCHRRKVMIQSPSIHEKLWSLVLAGGEGVRLRPMIQKWLGQTRPKQYCTFVGTRSMLQHTLDRCDLLTPRTNAAVVIGRNHMHWAYSQLRRRPPGRLIVQPKDCGTAAGIFLGLSYVRAADPDTTVAIFPSDHFVHPEGEYVEGVRKAVKEARKLRDCVILLGSIPDDIEPDYGYIFPGKPLPGNGGNVLSVRRFLEKPSYPEAAAAIQTNSLWNTFVIVAKLEKLWRLGKQYFPQTMKLFERFTDWIGTSREEQVLNLIYRKMPNHNFSFDLLQHATGDIGTMVIPGILWSDWGRPERIASSLFKIDKKPAFPIQRLEAFYQQAYEENQQALIGDGLSAPF
jgi:mannose-1-phosphate guanylyltransferase